MSDLTIHGDLPPVSELLRLGTELHKTGLLPPHIRSGGQAMAIILAGRELGLAPMTALRSIHLVEGRVTLAADLQLALVKRAGVKHRWVRTDAEVATVELVRAGDAAFTFSYGIEDAKRAGLADKQNWRRHTPAMLRARAITAAIRAYCPDILTTVYDPDELREGAGPDVDAEVEILDVEPEPAPRLAVAPPPPPALPAPVPEALVAALAAERLTVGDWDRWAELKGKPSAAATSAETAASAATWLLEKGGAARVRADLYACAP